MPPHTAGRLRPLSTLRASLRGYDAGRFRADLGAALTTAVVALPLSAGLAIATGLPPHHGLATAIAAGIVAGLAGGTRTNVTGPTAAFVVVLAPLVTQHGLEGLLLATMLAGLMLIGMAAAGLGRFVTLIPAPVVTGFTAGIGIVIGVLQLRDLLGLQVAHMPEAFPERVVAMATALPTTRAADAGIAALTLALLLGLPKLGRRIPAPLPALALATLVAVGLAAVDPAWAPVTIADRFGPVPRGLPAPALPWGEGLPSLAVVRAVLPAAATIAMLGALESLLCAVVADGMTGARHSPDEELFGQGLANLVAPLVGGFAATGALARTATSIRAGAQSPLASVMHAVFLLVALLTLGPALDHLPMAALASLLVVVAWNMAELPHVARLVRQSSRSDAAVLLTCLGLTVVFDMVVAVGVGVVLASLLFMRRMANLSEVRALPDDPHQGPTGLPPGVLCYQVAGPLFFGASRRAMAALETVEPGSAHTVVLDLSAVPVVDATGLVNLDSALAHLQHRGLRVVLAGLQPAVAAAVDRHGLRAGVGRVDALSELAGSEALRGPAGPSASP
ncbi:MAG: STAS domain-containing protein [Alphaproteobacteria bacterium]|nr:STAS domain-containing protein [Alphaproteobacteria bacterium]